MTKEKYNKENIKLVSRDVHSFQNDSKSFDWYFLLLIFNNYIIPF